MGKAEVACTLTDREISTLIHKSLYTTQRLLREGKIPGRKVGRSWLIPVKAFEEWLNVSANSNGVEGVI